MSEFVTESTNDVPQRAIMMWSGDPESVPAGWTLCDGNSPDGVEFTVPDLQDRFVVGAGDSYSVDDTGGAAEVVLDEDQMAEHDHDSGNLSASPHDHDNGSLSTSNHSHGNGSLSASNHSHGSGSLSASSHDHGSGSLSTDNKGQHSHSYSDQYRAAESTVPEGGPGTQGFDHPLTGDTKTTDSAGRHSHGVSGSTGSASPNVSGSTSSSGANVTGSTAGSGANVSGTTGSASPDISGVTGTAGSNGAHENRPPFYALAFIMKV